MSFIHLPLWGWIYPSPPSSGPCPLVPRVVIPHFCLSQTRSDARSLPTFHAFRTIFGFPRPSKQAFQSRWSSFLKYSQFSVRMTSWAYLVVSTGDLGSSWAGLGNSRDHLGSVLRGSWSRFGAISHVGVLSEFRRHLESVSEVMFANIAKPSKTLEGIAKMEVPKSRNL